MKLTIQVNEGPYQHQASDSAYHFAKAALDKGHEIFRVFFYHEAVYAGQDLAVPPARESSSAALWSELASAHSMDLVLCVASAVKRGVLDDFESDRHDKTRSAHEGFTLSGLGQLVDASAHCDRLITFGC